MKHYALMAIALILMSGIARAADPIRLLCAGKLFEPRTDNPAVSLKAESLVLDLEGGLVSGGLGDFKVHGFSDSEVTFWHSEMKDGRVQAIWTGRLDRITGEVTVTRSVREDGGKTRISTIYDLNCKPAKLLF